MQESQQANHLKKKRVGRACASCRLKKTKCNGVKPCNRCLLDNKICVFTEKKRVKEKNYPPGFIDLLEMRLDILSKSFEKLIQLARPYLPEVDQVIQQGQGMEIEDDGECEETETRPDYDVVPINQVISYLIQEKDLLNNLPVEWEQGARIAANFDTTKNMHSSSKMFAEHNFEGSSASDFSPVLRRSSLNSNSTNNANASTNSHINTNISRRGKKMEPPSPDGSRKNSGEEFYPHQILPPSHHPSHSDGLLSDLDSDTSNGNQDSSSPPILFGQQPTASLFAQQSFISSKNSSMTSLSNKYEGHSLQNEINPAPTLKRSSSSTTSSFQKTNNSGSYGQTHGYGHGQGNVHKPTHHRAPSIDSRRLSTSLSSPTFAVSQQPQMTGPEAGAGTSVVVVAGADGGGQALHDDFEGSFAHSADSSMFIINNAPTRASSLNQQSEMIHGGHQQHYYTSASQSLFDGSPGGYDQFMNNSFSEKQ
ncbi:uncharacterized protein LODBEIA_P31930 [Lodderomyces beijingensis]|uniref:Zn(2)-C6 fungal-type domain-containing protein n=1 Tax=Lodderomyces beijingensis TaxID=1775926 RepID=A0ABP0ZLE1_9ASCO